MTEAITAHEITIRRVFRAPLQLVWDAWTRPDQLARWWGPSGWSTPSLEMDVRPGGSFRATHVADEGGDEMTMHGVYREVVELERLVLEEPADDAWHEGAVSEVTFTDLGDGRTEMVVRSTVNTTDEMRAIAEAGMAGSFDRLAEHLGA
jgi:uncharacterized protein YndB with AHSA1/START domain